MVKVILGIFLLLLLIIFAVQNSGLVAIKFIFWEFSFSLALLLFLVLALGYLLGWFFFSVSFLKSKKSKNE